MDEQPSRCLGEVTVRAVVAGLVTGAGAERVTAHLGGCSRCSAVVSALATVSRGARISAGRYQIKRLLGEGGMGEVYVAHDPDLDREVALKLLQPGLEPHGAGLSDRLVREAMAMARLSHPNVVTVYDVGSFEDQVFIAMELVDGLTLSRWLHAQPRARHEIVEVFVAAGHGLAAAHRAGIVHGDFKPQNVLIDGEGRARVADFGLARPIAMVPARPTRELAGTPAYMAPELLDGAGADTRSDQFSFCVALYQALCGRLPFSGADPRALRDAMRASPSRSRWRQRAPGRVARALRRGLAEDPARRFSSMDALLRELTPRRSAGSAFLAVAAAGVAAAGIALWLLASTSTKVDRCDPTPRLAGIWDSTTRAAVHQSLLGAGQPESAIRYVEQRLDGYASGWQAAQRERCQTPASVGPEIAALRTHCLDARLAALTYTTQLLSSHEPRVVAARMVVAVDRMPPIERCQTVELFEGRVPQPTSPQVRTEVAAIRVQLVSAHMSFVAGRYAEALALTESLLPRARALSYRPIEAEALYYLGLTQSMTAGAKVAVETLREAAHVAEAGRHDLYAAFAWNQLTRIAADKLGDLELAQDMARHASAAVERVGRPLWLDAQLNLNLGFLDERRSRFDSALASYAAAVRGFEEAGETFDALKVKGSMASVYLKLGRYPEALAIYRSLQAAILKSYGEDHPAVAASYNNVAAVLLMMGQNEEALTMLRAALAILERSLRPDDLDLARAYGTTGEALRKLGRFEESLAHVRKASAILARTAGEDSVPMARNLEQQALSLAGLDRDDESIALQEKAVALLERRAPEQVETAEAHENLAWMLLGKGHLGTALAHARRAREHYRSLTGEESDLSAHTIGLIGLIELEAGRVGAARVALERSIALLDRSTSDPVTKAPLWFALARALDAAPRQSRRATLLAERARAAFAQDGPGSAHDVATVEAWLARKR